jgi:phage-related protein
LTISINIINNLGLDNLILKLSELWVAFTQLIQNITEILTPALTTFYETAISPIVQWIGEKLAEAVRFVTELFGSWGQWFIDNQESIQAFIDMLAGFVTGLWDIIKPIGDTVWDTFKGVIQSISDIFQGFFKWVIDNKEIVVASVGAITAGLLAYKAAVGISALIDAFKKGIIATTIAENGAAVAQWALNAAMNANPIGLVIAAITALVAGFVLLWNNCEDFRNFFINMWKEIQKSVKSVINGILSGIESFVNGIISGLNFLIRAINKISFNVPDWVPGIGGKKLGFNLREINKVSLPRLATGGYVAANTPQLAIIGDNKREGEIVAPESKITEAVVAAFRQFLPLFNNGGNNKPIYLTLKLGDGTFWEGFVDYHNDIVKRTGETPLLV